MLNFISLLPYSGNRGIIPVQQGLYNDPIQPYTDGAIQSHIEQYHIEPSSTIQTIIELAIQGGHSIALIVVVQHSIVVPLIVQHSIVLTPLYHIREQLVAYSIDRARIEQRSGAECHEFRVSQWWFRVVVAKSEWSISPVHNFASV